MKKYKDKLEIFNSLSELERYRLCYNGIYKNEPDSIFIYSKLIKHIGFIDICKFKYYSNLMIGIAIKPEYRNKGIARHLLKSALDSFKIKNKTISYVVDKENIASINLIESFNYNYVKDYEYDYEYIFNL